MSKEDDSLPDSRGEVEEKGSTDESRGGMEGKGSTDDIRGEVEGKRSTNGSRCEWMTERISWKGRGRGGVGQRKGRGAMDEEEVDGVEDTSE